MRHSSHRRSRRLCPLLLVVEAAILAASIGRAQASVRLVPEEYATIQAAVDAASYDDTVSIAPGTYRGEGNRDVNISGKAILLLGRMGSANTIIDMEQATTTIRITGGPEVRPVVQGISLTNGNQEWGGAVNIFIVSPTFRDCRFLSNAGNYGGAVETGGYTTFEDCLFAGNLSTNKGGAVCVLVGTAAFARCVFTGNGAWGGFGADGGAVESDGAPIQFSECTFAHNYAAQEGGAIFSFDVDVPVERCVFWGNCAGTGDDIRLNAPTRTVTLDCCVINMSGVAADQIDSTNVVEEDPLFCNPLLYCMIEPSGVYLVRGDSPCLPANNPCGVLIGALDQGCPGPVVGACCVGNGECVLTDPAGCEAQQGEFLGVGTTCDGTPSPCAPTPVETTSWGRIKANYRGTRK